MARIFENTSKWELWEMRGESGVSLWMLVVGKAQVGEIRHK